MKILFIAHGLYPCVHGGMEIFNYHLINNLKSYHDITVFTTCKKYQNKGVKICRDYLRLFGIQRYGFSKISLLIQDIIKIITLINKIDVIVFSYTRNSGFLGLYIPIIKNLLSFNYIVINHGGGLKPWKNKSINNILFKNASEVIAISKPIQKEYIKRTGRKIEFIPPLIPFVKSKKEKEGIRKKFGFCEEDRIVFYVGSLKSIKSPDTLLTGFSKLGKEFIIKNKVKLVFAGDGVLKNELEKGTKTLEIDKRVLFLGNVDNRYIKDIYKMGDIYVITSIFEGTPISMLEAMFNKKIIIASDVRGINNIIIDGKNGLLFNKNDSDNLSIKLKQIIKDFEKNKYLANNAYYFYEEKYNYKKMLKKYNLIFEEINR
jgi:glycosyltransferase involved in cell wall biosynthesis